MERFIQQAPVLPNSWDADRPLREALLYLLGDELFARAQTELREMGELATSPEVLTAAARAEREPPEHVPYATWGERIDEIRVSDAYTELGALGVRAGVAAAPYEDSPFKDRARIPWAALMCLWGPSSALYNCPIAMTDGAARTLLDHGGPEEIEVVGRLTSRDPEHAWTSGQWMTETAGGSDVSRTGTVARREGDGVWRLWGTKWFTSATTSEMALTLARPEGAPEGSRGLAMFRVHRHLDDGSRNPIVVRRLKDKLGTRALPTAELELEGAIAYPVGDPLEGGGVRKISTMLNVTRLHNSLGSVGSLARGLAWARAYARVREVFGRPLHTMPAHRATLTDLAVDHIAALALTLRCAELLGKVEHGTAVDSEVALLRGLTPLVKLATARWAVAGVTEAMEAVGGVGYCEDSSIPALVRNTHVQPIWEGTTNVLALDHLRAASAGSTEALFEDCRQRLSGARAIPELAGAVGSVERALSSLTDGPPRNGDREESEAGARSVALSTATTYACALLCAQGAWAAERGHLRTATAASRLAARGLLAPEPPADLTPAMED